MFLRDIIKNLNKNFRNVKFKDIKFNSKECGPNDVFFSIKGNNLSGNNYITEAIKNGAKIIISSLKFEGYDKNNILFIYNKNPRELLSDVASRIYKTKPKNIIAVTGTNGKTSIANFYYQILNSNKKKVAAIGTLGILAKKLNIKTRNTTLDAIKIHQILKKIKNLKIDNVILEASSHGLKQSRLKNIKFKTALFTNLSRDHLDYHRTFKDYLKSKLILFKSLLKLNGNIIFDNKVSQAKILNSIIKKRKLNKYDFGSKSSFINILNIQRINGQKKIVLSIKKKIYSFKTVLIGNIQIKNLIFAVMAAYLSNIKIKNIIKSLGKIRPIEGRLEKVGIIKNKSTVILDYAHTPDALRTAILSIKEDYPFSKISLVFGCGGNRDVKKRPIMGSIANKHCDNIYLTDDNPRLENPKLIRSQIRKGILSKKIIEIPSRAKAISKAVHDLKSGDILMVSGKGHENYQEYKSTKFFSDRLEILNAIKKKNFKLSKSIKTNIVKENLKSNILNKNNFVNFASLNSNKINKETIFIGVRGKQFDGNFYAKEALKNGAVLAISNKKFKNSKNIYHESPLNMFNNISSIYRKCLNANNIAITGSAGKTSVKELTSFCLKKLSKTYCSKSSYNNKYGVPLSLFNTPQFTKYVVLEVGMDRKGEIDYLTKIIKPDTALITNISYAHIKNFENLNQIAKAKGEIINNIASGGTIVLNADDKYFYYFLKLAKKKCLKIITFSKKNKTADVCFLNQKKNDKNFLINFKIYGIKKTFFIPYNLLNHKYNLLSSLSIIINYFDIDNLDKKLFLGFNLPTGRGSVINYKKGLRKLKIIDESYNSNPLSFKFALDNFNLNYKNNKKYLLFGDMLELGKHSKHLHTIIAKYINKSKVIRAFAYGNMVKHTFNKLRPQIKGKFLNSKMDVLDLIKNDLPNNSFLMVKGSNSTGLNKIIQEIKK